MLGVEGTQQVMLSVRFVEMDRSTAKKFDIGLNRVTNSGNPAFNFTTGAPIAGAFGSGVLKFLTPDGSLSVQLDALETKGVVKTLAEPTLVTMSGDTASFLAGGEFPYPTAQTGSSGGGGNNAAITVAFQQFGISLAFTPTILQDGMINLVVKPEVSSLDTANGVSVLGTVVPGLKVRRASTTVELRDGESFTIAGLLRRQLFQHHQFLPVARRRAGAGRPVPVAELPARPDRAGDRGNTAPGGRPARPGGPADRSLHAAVGLRAVHLRHAGRRGLATSARRSGVDEPRPRQGRC